MTNTISGRMTVSGDCRPVFDFAGAVNLGKYLRLLASITPGWLRQNEAFLPYTTNAAITGCGGTAGALCTTTASLPSSSLEGSKQTLAMNYTLVTLPWKSVQIKAGYRHYDYNNNTPVRTFTPVQGDASGARHWRGRLYLRLPVMKRLLIYRQLVLCQESSIKLSYIADWMDRPDHVVEHSLEQSGLGAVM